MNINATKKYLLLILALALTMLVQATPTTTPSLFKKYPTLKKKIGYVNLGNFPTRIKKLETLGALLGCNNLYMKMDNESGTLFGGNKVRKLEFLLGSALFGGAKGVVTWGYAGSNQTCATAAYCNKLGLKCICMHLAQLPTLYAQRNLLLSHHYGAELNFYRGSAERELDMYEKNRAFKKETGDVLYFVPSGGSNELGTLGFVNAALELKEQIQQGVMPEPDFIYVAIGSCATTAGLMLGAKIAGLKTTIVPICIEAEDFPEQHVKKTVTLYNSTSDILRKYAPTFPELTLEPSDIQINHAFAGPGYAMITPETRDAIKILQQAEDVKLDGSYAGKACAAMMHDIAHKKIQDKTILFWNSFCSGNFADIIGNSDYKALPKEYHLYFEVPMQEDDQGV